MSKLTLSVDREVISRAKEYAKERRISVSEMVENYLQAVTTPPEAVNRDLPVLRALYGVLKKANPADYRKHLTEKYR